MCLFHLVYPLLSHVTFILKVIANSTETLGEAVLKSRGFPRHQYWYWIGVGALIGYTLLFNICFTLALGYLDRGYHNLFQFNTNKLEAYVLMLYK